jgi:Holliday junction resolvasome RuvABC endonuclease subunit
MNIIGIDFSILYPGICISKDFKEFKWIGIANNKITKKDTRLMEDLVLTYPNLKLHSLGERTKKVDQYHINERNKLENYIKLTDFIIKQIKEHTKTKDNIIAIEGISFGSSGNSLVDISQATGIIKSKLLTLTDSIQKIFVFSPSELKNAIGCKGNASKIDVYNKFKEDPVIEKAKQSDLYKLLNRDEGVIFNGKNVKSPYMDMIDSYLPIVKIHNILKNNEK